MAVPGTTRVRVDVPVRVCDVGGWTDTWFAERGRVCSLAVEPGVSVQAEATRGTGRVTITVVEYDITFTVGSEPPEHRLLAEAVREAGGTGGDDVDVGLVVASAVPPGSSLGTSAAVCVGVIAALDALRGEVRPPGALAAAAHRAEAGRLGRQSGVQDQCAAAHGGANLIEIDPYPSARTQALDVPPACLALLDARLVHVAYGAVHDSSAVHDEVIARLRREGTASPHLHRLRHLAGAAAAALLAADLDVYSRVLSAATAAQAALHPGLVSDAARELIELARACDVVGWKVNGAGGGGGSLSVLCHDASGRDRLRSRLDDAGHRWLDLRLAPRGARRRP
jgi:D-glycero-alpha-D-manno-heptose-7-phosphate kinase